MRLVALAKGLTQSENKPDVNWFLVKYPQEDVDTPEKVDLLKVENESYGFIAYGGVRLSSTTARTEEEKAVQLALVAVEKRSDSQALSWEFDFDAIEIVPEDTSTALPLEESYENARLFQQALLLHENGMYEDAIKSFTEIISKAGENYEAYFYRGDSYRHLNDHPHAIQDYNKAIELNSYDALSLFNRGVIYMEKLDYPNALADFDRAININPNYFDPYYQRGTIHFRRRNYDNALDDYDKAIQLNTNIAQAYCNRGVIWRRKNNNRLAIRDYTKAIELDPSMVEAYNFRGVAYYSRNQLDKALTDFNKALSLDPKYASAYNYRATVWFYKKDYEKAWADIKSCRASGGKPSDDLVERLKKATGQ